MLNWAETLLNNQHCEPALNRATNAYILHPTIANLKLLKRIYDCIDNSDIDLDFSHFEKLAVHVTNVDHLLTASLIFCLNDVQKARLLFNKISPNQLNEEQLTEYKAIKAILVN